MDGQRRCQHVEGIKRGETFETIRQCSSCRRHVLFLSVLVTMTLMSPFLTHICPCSKKQQLCQSSSSEVLEKNMYLLCLYSTAPYLQFVGLPCPLIIRRRFFSLLLFFYSSLCASILLGFIPSCPNFVFISPAMFFMSYFGDNSTFFF